MFVVNGRFFSFLLNLPRYLSNIFQISEVLELTHLETSSCHSAPLGRISKTGYVLIAMLTTSSCFSLARPVGYGFVERRTLTRRGVSRIPFSCSRPPFSYCMSLGVGTGSELNETLTKTSSSREERIFPQPSHHRFRQKQDRIYQD